MKVLLFLLFAVPFMISCSGKNAGSGKDHILTEKDLIPEGVAFDTVTQTIYVSSTAKKKVIAIDKDGNVADFISEGQDSIKSVIGMEVDNRRNSLWVVSSEAHEVLPIKQPGAGQWRSAVYQFSLKDGRLIKRYAMDHTRRVFLNDLTVAADGTVYITESMESNIYRIAPGEDSVKVFWQIQPYAFANGICFADKPNHLFVATTEGIIDIDLNTKQFSPLRSAAGIDHRDIDGLSFTNGYFIGHQSTKVCRFYYNGDQVTKVDTLDSGKEFDSSTTGEIGNGYYYFIVNAQVQSGIDFQKIALKPLDSLENVIIRKKKL